MNTTTAIVLVGLALAGVWLYSKSASAGGLNTAGDGMSNSNTQGNYAKAPYGSPTADQSSWSENLGSGIHLASDVVGMLRGAGIFENENPNASEPGNWSTWV